MRTTSGALLAALAMILAGCTAIEDGEGPEMVPKGTALTSADIAALATFFDDQPLSAAQEPWPAHLLKWINPETFILLQFDANPAEATELLWVGLGVRGIFCDTDQPTPDFTHFHRAEAPSYDEGHGGDPGIAGFWLMHIALKDFESPFGPTGGPGVHEEFGPTPPPACPANPVPPVAEDPQPVAEMGADLTSAEIAAMAAIFDDQPLSMGQQPWPSHLIKYVDAETLLLAQFDAENVADATKLLWFGIGVRGTFCDDTQPDPDFTHFHRALADSYPEGHGGDPGMDGFWLLHAATHDFESPFGPTGGPGVHEQFGPTPPPGCPDA